MQKIAKTAARAIARLELARGLMEVGDGRQLGINGLAIKPSIIQIIARLLGVLLVAKFGVRVAGEVLAHVLADVELLNLAVLGLHFDEELLVRVVEVALQLFARVLVPVGRLRRVERTQVEVAQQYRLIKIFKKNFLIKIFFYFGYFTFFGKVKFLEIFFLLDIEP